MRLSNKKKEGKNASSYFPVIIKEPSRQKGTSSANVDPRVCYTLQLLTCYKVGKSNTFKAYLFILQIFNIWFHYFFE